MANTTEFDALTADFSRIEAGDNRSAPVQAGYQLLALLLTLVMAIVGGLITGQLCLLLILGGRQYSRAVISRLVTS